MKNLENLFNDFCTYKIDIEGKNQSSIDSYMRILRDFCIDMEIETYEDLINIKAQDIKNWLINLANKNNIETTRNNKLSVVKQIFLFLENEKKENIDVNIRNIKYAKTPYKESKYVDNDLAFELIAETSNQRTKSAIILIIKTGVRFKELMQISCSDIERGYAKIIGKGNKERTIWFNADVTKICTDFIKGKRKKIIEKTGVETDLLLISDNGKPMTRQSFSTSLKNLARRIGLYWYDEISPHKLRHGCISSALKEGVPINVVRDMAGHSNIMTTNRYAHTQEEQVKMAMLRD